VDPVPDPLLLRKSGSAGNLFFLEMGKKECGTHCMYSVGERKKIREGKK
jgi:hypothetical protein